MSKDETMAFVLLWSTAIILLYKWYQIYKKQRSYKKITCKVTDYTLRTTYHKNQHIYYYSYTYNKEEYTTSDTIRFKLFFFHPKIKDILTIYIDPKNPNISLTPFNILFNNIKLIIAVILLILPLLF